MTGHLKSPHVSFEVADSEPQKDLQRVQKVEKEVAGGVTVIKCKGGLVGINGDLVKGRKSLL